MNKRMSGLFSVVNPIVALLLFVPVIARAQEPNPTQKRISDSNGGDQPIAVFRVNVVSYTLKAVNFHHRQGSTNLDFRGTALGAVFLPRILSGEIGGVPWRPGAPIYHCRGLDGIVLGLVGVGRRWLASAGITLEVWGGGLCLRVCSAAGFGPVGLRKLRPVPLCPAAAVLDLGLVRCE